ncbi:hypothetical protein MRX96_023704 [Rhipicephalus microplus]
MASPNQITGYDPESLQIIQMDTAQTETPLPTEEEYLQDMVHAPTPKAGPKKAPAAKSNKPKLKKTDTGHSTNVKPGTPTEPPALVKDFPPLTPVQAQELEAKQVGSSEPVQEAEAEDRDDGSSVTSRLTSVSRQDADTVVGPASITGSIGRIESLEHKTEQLEASVAALPTQIMSAVRESFQDMFTAALTQALPEIVAQVKRKPASRQAAEEGFSGPAPGPDRSSAP